MARCRLRITTLFHASRAYTHSSASILTGGVITLLVLGKAKKANASPVCFRNSRRVMGFIYLGTSIGVVWRLNALRFSGTCHVLYASITARANFCESCRQGHCSLTTSALIIGMFDADSGGIISPTPRGGFFHSILRRELAMIAS